MKIHTLNVCKTNALNFLTSVILFIGFSLPLSVSAEPQEALGKVTSIDYSSRNVEVRSIQGADRYRILFDATIKDTDGEVASINQIRENSNVRFVYDNDDKEISYIVFRN